MEDQAVLVSGRRRRPQSFRPAAQRADGRPRRIDVVKVPGHHVAFIANAQATADLIKQAAEGAAASATASTPTAATTCGWPSSSWRAAWRCMRWTCTAAASPTASASTSRRSRTTSTTWHARRAGEIARARAARVLLGHSAGGVISCVYTLEHQAKLAGLICESFAFQVAAPDFALAVVKGLSHIAPHAHVLRLKNEEFSRDPKVVQAMNDDPLIAHEMQPTKTVAELVRADERLKREFPLITLPVLILHGTADKVTKPGGSQLFYDSGRSADKTLKLYDGHVHDLLNDFGKESRDGDVKGWKPWLAAQLRMPSRTRCFLGLARLPVHRRTIAAVMAGSANLGTVTTWTPMPTTLRHSSENSRPEGRHPCRPFHRAAARSSATSAGTGRGGWRKAVLIGAIPPLMLKTAANPNGHADRGVRQDSQQCPC